MRKKQKQKIKVTMKITSNVRKYLANFRTATSY